MKKTHRQSSTKGEKKQPLHPQQEASAGRLSFREEGANFGHWEIDTIKGGKGISMEWVLWMNSCPKRIHEGKTPAMIFTSCCGSWQKNGELFLTNYNEFLELYISSL